LDGINEITGLGKRQGSFAGINKIKGIGGKAAKLRRQGRSQVQLGNEGRLDGINGITGLGKRQGSFDGINEIKRIGEGRPNFQIFQITKLELRELILRLSCAPLRMTEEKHEVGRILGRV
jgi:hypothetical protein